MQIWHCPNCAIEYGGTDRECPKCVRRANMIFYGIVWALILLQVALIVFLLSLPEAGGK